MESVLQSVIYVSDKIVDTLKNMKQNPGIVDQAERFIRRLQSRLNELQTRLPNNDTASMGLGELHNELTEIQMSLQKSLSIDRGKVRKFVNANQRKAELEILERRMMDTFTAKMLLIAVDLAIAGQGSAAPSPQQPPVATSKRTVSSSSLHWHPSSSPQRAADPPFPPSSDADIRQPPQRAAPSPNKSWHEEPQKFAPSAPWEEMSTPEKAHDEAFTPPHKAAPLPPWTALPEQQVAPQRAAAPSTHQDEIYYKAWHAPVEQTTSTPPQRPAPAPRPSSKWDQGWQPVTPQHSAWHVSAQQFTQPGMETRHFSAGTTQHVHSVHKYEDTDANNPYAYTENVHSVNKFQADYNPYVQPVDNRLTRKKKGVIAGVLSFAVCLVSCAAGGINAACHGRV